MLEIVKSRESLPINLRVVKGFIPDPRLKYV